MMTYVVGTSVADDGKAPVVSVDVFLDAYSAWAWWQELMRSDGLKVAAPIPRDSPFAYGNPTATRRVVSLPTSSFPSRHHDDNPPALSSTAC